MRIAVIAEYTGTCRRWKQCSPTSSIATSIARSTLAIAYLAHFGPVKSAICLWHRMI